MVKGLYIQIHSMHGLFRSRNLELGRDEDTGGQIVYVLSLAKELGKLRGVDKVDILTRMIKDPKYPGYSKKIEKVSKNVNIVRIPCGGDKYIKKVHLWPHIDEFVKNTKEYMEDLKRMPDILHSNYADSGYVCTVLSRELGIPQVHTGHSLGRPKMKGMGIDDKSYEEFDKKYSFTERLMAESATMEHADVIITSTKEEILNQYGMYNINVHDPKFKVVPPGIDTDKFRQPKIKTDSKTKGWKKLEEIFTKELREPDKPVILALSRMEYRKNVIALAKAFAFDKELQSLANLAVFVGSFEQMGKKQKDILGGIQTLIRENGLEERICLPSVNLDFDRDVPPLYRLVATKKGVFVNPALIEPFGLTILEASASGLPVVSTQVGGPSEIITEGKNGFLTDPRDHKQIANAVKKLLKDQSLWQKFSRNGVKNVMKRYTWKSCAKSEYKIFKEILSKRE